MAINLSNFLNGNSVYNQQINQTSDTISQALNNAVRSTSSVSNPSVSAGNVLLQNLLAGDTFTGLVLGIKDNQVSLALGNGASLTATLSENVQLQCGQNITFLVEENNENHISLKPMAANEQQAVMINKALEGANLPLTKDNISIVKELFSLNMPVNAKTINEMIHQSAAFPETDYHTLANMLRLEIPVTADNIAQYEAYTHFENNISDKMQSMGENLVDGLINWINDSDVNDLNPQMAKELINTLYQSSDGSEIKSSFMSDIFNNEELDSIAKDLSDALSQINGDSSNEEIINQLKDNKMTVKQFVDTVLNLNNDLQKDNEALKKLISSDTFKTGVHQIINETMKLIPEDVKENHAIPDYYNRIKKTLEHAEEVLDKNGNETGIQKDMNQVKANIDFMNDLNKNMTFFQMPVKFSESEGNGELYVFTNKKALKNNTDNVSALLHLDMENLGPMDVFVKLAGKNVSTNFCLESEEMLDFVYSHIDELNERLEKLGLTTHFEMKVSNSEEHFDFEKDFIEKDIRNLTAGQYIFDSRV